MLKQCVIDLLQDQVKADKQAGNITEFYFEIPGHPGISISLEHILDVLSDPATHEVRRYHIITL